VGQFTRRANQDAWMGWTWNSSRRLL